MTNSLAAEDTLQKLKIRLINIDLLKAFELKERQEICCFKELNEGDKQFKIVYIWIDIRFTQKMLFFGYSFSLLFSVIYHWDVPVEL